jgi:hypothetical protein
MATSQNYVILGSETITLRNYDTTDFIISHNNTEIRREFDNKFYPIIENLNFEAKGF